jgi:hypothetical protein
MTYRRANETRPVGLRHGGANGEALRQSAWTLFLVPRTLSNNDEIVTDDCHEPTTCTVICSYAKT